MDRYWVSPFGFSGHDTPPFESDELAIAYAAGLAWGLNTEVKVYRMRDDGSAVICSVEMDAHGNHIATYSDTGLIIANPEPPLSTERRMRFRGRHNASS